MVAGVMAVLVAAGAGVWRVTRTRESPGASVRINQLQFDGTHNSYHQQLSSREATIARLASPDAGQLDYGFPLIGDQLRSGIRVLELDLWPDPNGGLYADPLIRRLAGLGRLPGLDAPGTKVLHIADVDYRTSCPTLVACLNELAAFDRAEPAHTPVFVMLEFKRSDPRLVEIGGVRSAPWDAAALATVDAEIARVLGDRVITPDDVRRPGRTLEQSVLDGGWPTLDRARGRTLFAMADPPGPVRDTYLAAHPGLEGRMVFTQAEPGQPDAAVLKRDEPTGADATTIPDLVRRGYLVRTRADDGPADAARLAAARASGAQLVSTDHPETLGAPTGRDGPGDLASTGLVRCNPVSAPTRCATSMGLEALAGQPFPFERTR